jgi:hypothetical protein
MNSSCESEPQRSFTFPGFKVDSMDEELTFLCITRQKKSTDFVSQQTQRPATNQTQSCVQRSQTDQHNAQRGLYRL